jgi:hypothetical protein
MRWTWQWATVCPATSPALIPMLKPSTDLFVGSDDLGSNRIKEKADGPSLGLIKVEVSWDVSARDSQSVQRRHGEPVADSHRKLVLGDHPFTHVAEPQSGSFSPSCSRTARKSVSSLAPLLALHL